MSHRPSIGPSAHRQQSLLASFSGEADFDIIHGQQRRIELKKDELVRARMGPCCWDEEASAEFERSVHAATENHRSALAIHRRVTPRNHMITQGTAFEKVTTSGGFRELQWSGTAPQVTSTVGDQITMRNETRSMRNDAAHQVNPTALALHLVSLLPSTWHPDDGVANIPEATVTALLVGMCSAQKLYSVNLNNDFDLTIATLDRHVYDKMISSRR